MNPVAASDDWLVPDWPAPAGVRALCTTRAGGVSAAPWDSLNLGDHVGDAARAVHENRARLRARLAGAQPVFMRQVHGSDVLVLDGVTTQGLAADACVTLAPGVACTVMVADCLPVLFAHAGGAAVAAAHAGWRGLAGTVRSGGRAEGVLESTFGQFAMQLERAGVAARADIAGQTLAWLGPCIGPTAFEVGEEVRTALCQGNPEAQRHFRPQPAAGKYLADLAGLARQRLQALGINAIHGNDGTARWCTVGNPSAFFSHRRDAARLGSSGRFAACIWRDPA